MTTGRTPQLPPRSATRKARKPAAATRVAKKAPARLVLSPVWTDGEVTIHGLRTVSEANRRGHWGKHAGRTKQQRMVACRCVERLTVDLRRVQLPARFVLTRIAPRDLDGHDNLRVALKAVVDGIADAMGVTDRDPRISFEYAQEKRGVREYAVRIEVVREAVRS